MTKSIMYEMDEIENNFYFDSNILREQELTTVAMELLEEKIDSFKNLKPNCDKIDYSLAVSSGILTGILDVFFVGNHKDGTLIKITDKWVDGRIMDFSRLFGWDGNGGTTKAILNLENKFKVPYDQRGAGDAGSNVFNLTPRNHHFKSLGHQPNLLGLFFSVLDQFTNQSHFVSGGELIALSNVNNGFKLEGTNIISKIMSGVVNWFGHLISDLGGSSGSKGRGMGIPSPIWTWANNLVVIKRKVGISTSEFDKMITYFSLKLFESGYDSRVHVAELIPVFINELLTRFFYTVRRGITYFETLGEQKYNFDDLWHEIKPYDNTSVKRMLTVAHGGFCLIDLTDVVIHQTLMKESVVAYMRLNIMGLGRFTFSLFGEGTRYLEIKSSEKTTYNAKRELSALEYYLNGLNQLSLIYDDKDLKILIRDFSNSDIYKQRLSASVEIAKMRNVSDNEILITKEQGDNYFKGE